MKRILWKFLGIVLILIGISIHPAKAQEANLSLRLEIDENLVNSQSIDIQSLLSMNGKGPNLFRMYLNNENASEYANNLYFEIIVSSEKIGRIAQIHQVDGQPFSLDPGQQIYATNNTLSNGLPGVEEAIRFDGDLTSEGQSFANDLKGSTSLPADRYTAEVRIYQGSSRSHEVASAMAEVGANIIEDSQDFYLLSPGDMLDSDARIANPYPNFQWQGASADTYRLLVVESKENESPQSLLEGAASTRPTQENGNGDSLVDYEMLDIVLNQSNFQYPSSGVQVLEPGQTYYWRVISQMRTSSGQQHRESEIWSFTLEGNENQEENTTAATDVDQALETVLGEQLKQFTEQGYSFEGMQIEGRNLTGGQALQELMELSRRAEEGDISIVIESQ